MREHLSHCNSIKSITIDNVNIIIYGSNHFCTKTKESLYAMYVYNTSLTNRTTSRCSIFYVNYILMKYCRCTLISVITTNFPTCVC